MNEVIRYSSFACLIILNQILLATNLWPISPDLFLVHTLIYTTFVNKIPNIYLFIFMGFLIDLFFSNTSVPYTITYFLVGLYLNFSSLKWIQRSLLEQLILIISISFCLNILLFYNHPLSKQQRMKTLYFEPLGAEQEVQMDKTFQAQ